MNLIDFDAESLNNLIGNNGVVVGSNPGNGSYNNNNNNAANQVPQQKNKASLCILSEDGVNAQQ